MTVRVGLLMVVVHAVSSQIMTVEGTDEHNMVYQVLVPQKEFRVNSPDQTLYYIHKDGFENCSLAIDFFSSPADTTDMNAEGLSAKLTVMDSKGKTLLTKSDKEQDEANVKVKESTVNAAKAGYYSLRMENLGSLDMSAIVLVNFRGCKNFSKIVNKDEMEEVNRRADNAIGTLFHNLVELEHSEGRLTHRKESKGL